MSAEYARKKETDPSSIVKTYLYLRLSLVVAVVLVLASLAIEIATSGEWLNSISHYYYTPVRSVFVGALVGMGFALVALAGRPGPEDSALTLAGMLAPVVAFVPTPVSEPCPSEKKCVPDEFVPSVVNNIMALLLVGAIAIILAAITARRLKEDRGWARWTITIAALAWLGAFAWIGLDEGWLLRASFLRFAHYGAAIPMFALIVTVVIINGYFSKTMLRIAKNDVPYWLIYRGIAVLMILILIIGFAYWMATMQYEDPPNVIFWVEFSLLVLFGLFWTMQTWEFRRTGLPFPLTRGGLTAPRR